MDQKALRPNLRSTVFTEALRDKLQKAQQVIRELSALQVRVLRTDYSGARPLVEIDPTTAQPVAAMPISMMSSSTPAAGVRRICKVIGGCEVVWQEAA